VFAAAPASYDITVTKAIYDPGEAHGVVIVDGGSTLQNFALVPHPSPRLTLAEPPRVMSESCAPETGTIDPGETVSLYVPLQNTGQSDAGNLVATLLPSGGVTAPGPPETYGAMRRGGAAVARTFSFKADDNLSCGAPLTVTLSLDDGPVN